MEISMASSKQPEPPPDARYVFVYGTLRRGEQRDINLLLPAPLWVGYGIVQGLLYDLGTYPGLLVAREGGQQNIRGEVYAITPRLEQLLDEIEEVWPQQTGEYSKLEIQVVLDGDAQMVAAGAPESHHKKLRCLVYEIHGSRVKGMAQITSGDWVRHRLSMRK
jgi:gamma-glutamylcyclotransferase (GGCT)/AIG2-like uncharacterized protein YtfP